MSRFTTLLISGDLCILKYSESPKVNYNNENQDASLNTADLNKVDGKSIIRTAYYYPHSLVKSNKGIKI